jgi:hypothetical protein
MIKNGETLTVAIAHNTDDSGLLSELTLVYPALDNNTANMMQIDIVRALADVAEKWNQAKQGR